MATKITYKVSKSEIFFRSSLTAFLAYIPQLLDATVTIGLQFSFVYPLRVLQE